MWFEIELGVAYLKKKQYGPAFRMFKFIEKHFQDMYEDQFDFHQYCLRKYQLMSYINTIRYENKVYENKFYFIPATWMIKG